MQPGIRATMSTPFLEASTIGKNYDELFKLLLIGNSGVGKTSIVNSFTEPNAVWAPLLVGTIGVDFKVRTCERCDKIIKMQIWDTAGQERFRAIVASYYRGAQGIILAYDVTEPESLRHVAHVWLKEVEHHAHSQAKLILVGNKVDLASQCPERVALTRAMAKELMASNEGRIVAHVETSAKTGANVSDAFMGLVDALMADRDARAVLRGKKGDTHRLSGGAAIPLSERAGFCAC